jgi:nucleotide-binding universal stress UspA family protein
MATRVLVATDGSEHSMKAVRKALEMAQTQGAKVTLMSVAYYSRDDFDEMPPNIQDKLESEAVVALNNAKALFDAQGIEVETVMEAGVVPANNIIHKAEQGKFDQIIMGSTGATGLQRILMGSTASKVVAHAPCSVTIVR